MPGSENKYPPIIKRIGAKKFIVLRDCHSGEELLNMLNDRRKRYVEDFGEAMGQWIDHNHTR